MSQGRGPRGSQNAPPSGGAVDVDVALVGAGPAGSAAAIGLLRLGLSVALLEKSVFPRHKICGDFLTPGATAILAGLASDDLVSLAPCPVRGMRITFEERAIASRFPGSAAGCGLTRRELDAALALRAAREGALMIQPFTARRTWLDRDGARVVEGSYPDGSRRSVRARLVVESGGRYGPFGRALGWRRDDPWLERYALWSHMEGVRGLDERGEMHVFEGGYVGVGARDLSTGLANVTMVLTPRMMASARGDPRGFFLAALARHPEMGPRSEGARFATPLRGIGPLACRASKLGGDRLALVGDAGGFVDPFTGEGVFLALASARLLAEAIERHGAGDPGRPSVLASYGRAHRRAFNAKLALCRLLQVVIARPRLARHIVRALTARQDLADGMVGAAGDLFPAAKVLAPGYLGRLLVAGVRA